MDDKIKILDVKLDRVNMEQACTRVEKFIDDDMGARMVVTPNSEMIVMAQKDRQLFEIINSADLSVPDGAGVILASRILNNKLEERVAGFDLMNKLFERSVSTGYSIYFLGGSQEVVHRAREYVEKEFSGINICGVHNGYLNEQLRKKVVEEINCLSPDLLFVGMGVPLQEKFIYDVRGDLNVGAVVAIGGSFDVLAGEKDRAPLWMQKSYLEWFYRLLKEPWRFWRMLALPRFMFMVLWEKLWN